MTKYIYSPVAPRICIDCSEPRDTTSLRCSSCVEKRKIAAKEAKRGKVSDPAYCKCGKIRDNERFMTCNACREYTKKHQNMYREKCRQNNICSQCGKEPSLNGKECQKCAESRRDYRRNNLERQQSWHRKYNQKIRQLVIAAYGGKCACCGESDYRFLTIDHVNGDGAAHTKQIKQPLTSWLKANNYPKEGFQCLCYNCNCAKWQYGACPHKLPITILI